MLSRWEILWVWIRSKTIPRRVDVCEKFWAVCIWIRFIQKAEYYKYYRSVTCRGRRSGGGGGHGWWWECTQFEFLRFTNFLSIRHPPDHQPTSAWKLFLLMLWQSLMLGKKLDSIKVAVSYTILKMLRVFMISITLVSLGSWKTHTLIFLVLPMRNSLLCVAGDRGNLIAINAITFPPMSSK